MATQRSSGSHSARSHSPQRFSALKKSRKFRERTRQEARRLHLEQLEDRRVMAVFILPNNGVLLNNGDTRTVAPKDLTFRFTDVPGIDPATIATGIRLTRAGQDGAFGQANDVVIAPGFIGIGDTGTEVVMRFAETLPDDTYRVTIVGSGTNPLRDTDGDAFNNGVDVNLNFRLDLGAQVIAVVPQPVRRIGNNPGTLVMNEVNPNAPATTRSTQNMIYVYFNDDDLDPTAATTLEFYRLYVTRNTLDPSDDTEVLPTSVEYDPATNLVRLIFGQVSSLDQLASFDPVSGVRDPIGSFRLRIGTNEPARNGGLPTVVQQLGAQDPGSNFAGARNLGSSVSAGVQGATVAVAQAIEAQAYTLVWPGSLQDPGDRDIPAETHIQSGADTNGGVDTIFYNFRPVIGSIPDGLGGFQTAFNLITENQKQRSREIFDLYSRYSGVQFIESESSGLTVSTGDLRVLDPEIPTGPGGVAGIAGSGLAIMDNAEDWNDSYGANWFQVAMHEIGHLLGQDHTYDLPPLTIQGDDGNLSFGVGAEPVFPGDHDIVHMRHMHRPDSKDIDMFRFTLDGTGVLTLEAFAERLPNSSSLDTHLRLYREGAGGLIEEIARNDDYFSKDSKIELTLGAGTYFVGVSASGNDQYDPNIVDSGMNGTTQGAYELKLDFRKSATQSIVDRTLATGIIPDTLNVAFDGDADGTPGGVHNFWFRAAPNVIQTGRARTIFVDKMAAAGGNGLLSQPFQNIDDALTHPTFGAKEFDIVRIIGNGGADGNLATLGDNRAYQLGFGGALGTTPLPDGTELSVPKNVTVMIDAGAIFQLRRSQVVVGSTSPATSSDHSGAALQVLGTPTTSVYFTSYNEVGPNSVGLDQNPLNVPAAAGDWGGIAFRNDLDAADGRFDHEQVGVFLNYVNHADMRFGGGQVLVDSVSQVITPIDLLDRRPTISFNTIRNSANAALSANPDSFEETNFQAPRYWRTFASTPFYNPSNIGSPAPSTSFTLDYSRVGPEIHGNRLLNNTTNALFVRTRTPAGNVLEELTVSGRFDDTDIVHVLEENLVIRGTPSGPTLETTPPPVSLIFVSALTGQGNFAANTTVQYKLVFVDLLGNESLASQTFSASTTAAGSAIFLEQLPQVPSPQFVARKLYRRTSPTQPFTLVDQIPASVDFYIDRNIASTAPAAQLKALSSGTFQRPRLDAGLVIDPSIIIKSDGARIDADIGSNFIAEGFAGQEIVFTSMADDRYGAGNTFDTNNDSPRLPTAPVIATLTQGSTGVNERQTITLPGSPTTGAFTLTFNGQTTGPIVFNATALVVQTALEGLSNIVPGDVAVTLTSGVWTVTFQGAYAGQNVPQMTGAIAALGAQPLPGDWGGIYFWADSKGSIDNAVFAYAGGLNRIEGTFAGFNPIEIHQADVRITQSKFEFNADGQGGQAPASRFGRGFNAPGTIFVRGAQPIIMDNVGLNSGGAFININVNALNSDQVVDLGRQSGLIEREPGHFDNNGPLVLRNRMRGLDLTGMIVRGGTLTTESVWDDTDIVHILFDEVNAPDFHVFGGLRLESSATQSLVVKASGATAGFTATGRPLEIDDRIGGMLHILGQPGVPVILTGLSDDTVGAGFTPEGVPLTDTDGNGQPGGGGGGGGLPTGPEVDNGTLIDNDVATGTVGHFEFRPGPGGISVQSGVTAQGQTQLFINQDYIFDFINYVDIGPNGGAIDLSTTTITTPPTLLSPDLVFSAGTFQGANGVINWRVETRIDNGTAIVNNTLTLTSAQPFGALRFINYLDEDVLGVSDDLLFQSGSPGQANFRLFTLDNTERIGFAQGGTYAAGTGLVNATYDGWAADEFADLRTIIAGGGTTYTPTGNIDLVDLTPFVDPALGNVHGLADITTAMAWTLDPAATSATILTFLELIPQAPATPGNPGEWQGVTIDQWAHDRNVETILELETGDGTGNSIPQKAQFLGGLGPFEKGGDENLRLGFNTHGVLASTSDVDVYSFSGKSGTEVWIDIDRTTDALDVILELIDNNGNVVARSNNSPAESAGAESLALPARRMQKTPPFEGSDFYTTNPRDGGMRLLLPGPANTTNTYFVRVRSAPSTLVGEIGNSLNPGLTAGAYQLSLRLREVDELGGTTVRFTKIANAVNGIHVIGQPTHSPLTGEATETNDVANNVRPGAQFIGNLLTSDRGMLATAGALNGVGDIDWYSFTVNYNATQGIPGVSTDEDWWSTIFDMDYADGFARPNLTFNVYDENGNLVLSTRDSNVADDRPNPLNAADVSDLTRGSSGAADPWIGPVELPQGRYFLAISSDNQMSQVLDQFTSASSATPLVRMEPANSVVRLVEDHIGSTGGSDVETIEVNFIDQNSIVPWNLHDVTLFVTQDGGAANTTEILTVDPFSGAVETIVGRFGRNTSDLAMHPRGRLHTYSIVGETNNFIADFADANVGNYLQIDPATGGFTLLGDDNIETYEQDPTNPQPAAVRSVPQPRQGEGIHFRGMNIGVGFNQGYLGFAVGGRDVLPNINDFRNDPVSDLPNILYMFNPDTGLALPDAPVRTGNGLLAGARTQIVERGILDTFVDLFPQGNADAVTVVEATIVDQLNGDTTFQILDVGYTIPRPPEIPANFPSPTTFRVTQGPRDEVFEFDAGPEALFEVNRNVINQQIFDQHGFSIDGVRLEFDTGHVINVTGIGNVANYPVGSSITITDVDPDPLGPGTRAPRSQIFEFTTTGNTTIPNALPILVAGSASQMVDTIVTAINSAPNFTTSAQRLGNTGRISLTNNRLAFPTIDPNTDSTAAENNVPGLNIVAAPGGQIQNSIVIRAEETFSQAELRDMFQRTGAFPGVNAAGILPVNSVPGVSGPVNGFNRITVGFDGNRINFSGATNITTQAPFMNANVFQTLGSQGGVAFGNVPVPFLAEDGQIALADRMVLALQGAGYTGVSRTPTGSAVIISGGNVLAADAPLQTAAEAPGGIITGLASINGVLFAVSDTGGLFRIVSPTSGFAQLDYINTATALVGVNFSGLTAGPRHVEGGRFQNMLFGIAEDGELFAFNTQGIPQPVFASAFNPATGLIEVPTSVQTGLTGVHGLAFSNVDYNLFHTTPNREGNAGHGINEVFDDSREAVEGGSSLYFGFESVGRNNISSGQLHAPTAGLNTYDLLGGAHGSVESNTFSLKGYSAADQPHLYFNYFLETEGAGHNNNTPIFMRDSFRVFVSGDDGVWHLLGTNNGNRFNPNPALPPNDEIDYAPLRVNELWDNTSAWRQARIPLGNFAGRDNLKLRFDFSSAGSMNVGNYVHLNDDPNTPTTGTELRTVDGVFLRDVQTFTLGFPGVANRTYEFDMGYTLVAPNGVHVPDGARFTVNNVIFEFDRNGTLGGGAIPVTYLAADSPAQLAQRIALAISTALPAMPIQVNGNRLNLRGGPPGGVGGATTVTATGLPATFVEGAPGGTSGTLVPVHAGMSRDEVREAIALVFSGVYTEGIRAQVKSHNEIIRLIGIQLLNQAAGPNADPLNQRLLGLTSTLPGDEFGAFNVGRNIDGTTDNDNPGALRGAANNFEGLYLDDIIIGFAERGEMVTGAGRDNSNLIANPRADVDTNIPTGAYQIDIRRGAEAGVPTGLDVLPRLDLLPQIDPNDRQAESRTLVAPAGNQISDGQFFTLSDGVNQVTFEFNDLAIPGSGVIQGRIRIDFSARDTDYVMAQRIRNAINSAPVQSVLKISAGLADGVLGTGSTSNRVNLYGTISVPNAGTVPGAGVIAPPTGPEINNGTLIDNDVLVNAVGHFNVRPSAGGNIDNGQSGVTVQGVTQQLINQNFIFEYLNLVDLGLGGDAIDLSTTTITQGPTLIGPDLVESRGSFDGPNGLINWVVQTRFNNGSLVVANTITFSSAAPLGNLRFINYLDEDVLQFSDDLLYQSGAPGQADFRLFTLDSAERVGFSQGGVYSPGPGLVNATYEGWAADAFRDLLTAIETLGTSYSIGGNIDLADLPPRVDGKLGRVNGLADVTTAMAWIIDPSATSATVTTFLELLPVDPPGNLNFVTNTELYGDRNQFRDQGQIILQGNEISNSSEWGILIDASPRVAADGDKPHPGSVRNLRELNLDRLVPGVVVTNNTLYNNDSGGIRFSGDPAADGVVPFGRIVNNSIFGQGGTLTGGVTTDVGIQIDQNAAPTVMNNIVANFNVGINVDATSQGPTRTVLGGTVFQGNRTPSNIGLGSSFPILLQDTEPLFINPTAGNFYLAAGSRAIDSSVDSLLDRPPLVTVRNPLGIPQSPILAPDRDGVGQLRVDDPSVSTPQGFGLNPFKDRGAIDRVDFVGPTSVLVNPPDNDADGTDLDPAPTVVVRSNDIIRDFRIQLIDRFDVNGPPEGSDIDDLSVVASSVVIEVTSGPNPVTLQQGIDYSFGYDSTNNTIILTPLGGLWPLGRTYRVTLDNSVATGIKDRAGNVLLQNQLDGSHTYTIFLGSAIDFGDAPDTYGTLLASNGPSHQMVPTIRLGPTIGAESDGQPSPAADADPSDDGISDFVLFPGGGANSSSITVLASFSVSAFLDGWIDLNQDGDFGDAGEYVVQGRALTTPGAPQTLSFTLPNSPRGSTFARFRLSTAGINSPSGPALDGEVEDYQVLLVGPQFQNGELAEDVDNSDVVSILDLLIVVSYFETLFGQLTDRPGNTTVFVPPTSAHYDTPVPTFDPTGGGVPREGRFVDVTGDGIISQLDINAIVNYLTLNFSESEGEGEGEGAGEGEGSAPPAALAAASGSTLVGAGTSSATSSDQRQLQSASLLAAPNIILEVRERPSEVSLDADWTPADNDDALSLVAAAAAIDERAVGRALTLEEYSRRKPLAGPLESAGWEDLLGELALDVGGLPGDAEDEV